MSNILLMIIPALVMAFIFNLVLQARVSRRSGFAGLENGRLKPCPSSPNAICSEYPEDKHHYIPPVDTGLSSAQSIALAAEAIRKMGGSISINDFNYLSATFRSPLFGFVDDFEVRYDQQKQLLHIRSASRVGYGDMGLNKKRSRQFMRCMKRLQDQETQSFAAAG